MPSLNKSFTCLLLLAALSVSAAGTSFADPFNVRAGSDSVTLTTSAQTSEVLVEVLLGQPLPGSSVVHGSPLTSALLAGAPLAVTNPTQVASHAPASDRASTLIRAQSARNRSLSMRAPSFCQDHAQDAGAYRACLLTIRAAAPGVD